MAGRGATTFQKRQKEQQRKEKRAEKLARRAERKQNPIGGNEIASPEEMLELDLDTDTDDDAIVGSAEIHPR
jgi:hypothetical protein